MKLLALFFLLAPAQVLALSCMRYGVTDAYLDAAAARETYVVVYGRLDFDAEEAPESHQRDTPALTRIAATVSGTQWLGAGQKRAFNAPIEIEIRCAGPWCPNVKPGKALMFLKSSGDDYVLATNACGGFLFQRPLAEQLNAARMCMAGQQCKPSEER